MSLAVPKWLNAQLFAKLLERIGNELDEILDFQVTPALGKGENYVTKVLRVTIEAQLKDKTKIRQSYLLKLPLEDDAEQLNEMHDLFVNEVDMYERIIPELEQIHAQYGQQNVKFKPEYFRFENLDAQHDYLLLEDLQPKGYLNCNRLEGLNQTETEAVLSKLAQWHAASVKRVELFGTYGENYRQSYFAEQHRTTLEDMTSNFNVTFMDCLKHLNLTVAQECLLRNYCERLTEHCMRFGIVNDDNFNVLNHGDFWCNNFLFKYRNNSTANGIEDVSFIDFQLPKFGTPAQDLFHLLITSPNFDIKLSKFDHFIEHYHKMLTQQLELLQCRSVLPSLAALHASLRTNGVCAFIFAQRMLPAVLLPPNDLANFRNLMGNDANAIEFRRLLFENPVYIEQMKHIIPWLINKGFIA